MGCWQDWMHTQLIGSCGHDFYLCLWISKSTQVPIQRRNHSHPLSLFMNGTASHRNPFKTGTKINGIYGKSLPWQRSPLSSGENTSVYFLLTLLHITLVWIASVPLLWDQQTVGLWRILYALYTAKEATDNLSYKDQYINCAVVCNRLTFQDTQWENLSMKR